MEAAVLHTAERSCAAALCLHVSDGTASTVPVIVVIRDRLCPDSFRAFQRVQVLDELREHLGFCDGGSSSAVNEAHTVLF